MIKEINVTTGDEFIREFSVEEIAELEKAQAQAEMDRLVAEQTQAKRQELLDRLGITADEAKLLLG